MRRITLIILLLAAVTACTQRYVSYTDVAKVNGVGLFYAAEGLDKPAVFGFSDGGIMAGEHDLILEEHTRLLLDFFERTGY